jgi:hypothetical protein
MVHTSDLVLDQGGISTLLVDCLLGDTVGSVSNSHGGLSVLDNKESVLRLINELQQRRRKENTLDWITQLQYLFKSNDFSSHRLAFLGVTQYLLFV